jgi:hypothetical protein
MIDKLAVYEVRPDGSVLVRGYGFGISLAQFAWVVLVPEGAVVPADKLGRVRDCLAAMGYQLTTAAQPTPPTRSKRRVEWPECAACTGPIRRAETYPDTCPHCQSELVVMQADPDWVADHKPDGDPGHAPAGPSCADHDHGLYQIWPMPTYQHPALDGG